MSGLLRVLFLFSAFLLSACAGLPGSGVDKDALNSTLDRYGSAIRWGEFAQASLYLRKPGATELPKPEKTLADGSVRVTRYVRQQVRLDNQQGRADVLVMIEYHGSFDTRIRELQDRQVWQYDADSGRWWLESGLPAFKL